MILAVVLSLSVVSAADNGLNNTLSDKDNVDIVKSNSNEILGDGDEATFTDLANDIESVESTLNLNKSYIYNSTNDSSIPATGIKISKSIIINGNGHTIDAMGAKRIFEINASNVVLKNIIFTHGRHNTEGGAIYVQTDFENITIENCSFIQNSALLRGGAIYTAGTVDVNNCRFIENKLNGSSSNDRAAGAIYLYGNNSIISNSLFHLAHSGSEGYGGALYLYGSNTTIISCNFTNNTSTRWGGAINDGGAVKSYKIIDCNFIGNSAYYGGAAFNSNAGKTSDITCIVDRCYFDNNKLTGTADTDNGGVLRFVGSGALVNNSYFVSNSITSHGTILFQSSSSYNYVNNCTFLNNKALNGGAVYISGKYCNVTNCRVDNQSVSGTPHYGAGLYVSGQYNSVINCNFTNCSGNDHGATICWQGNYGSVINSIFINNRITVNARAGAAIRWTGNNGVITGSTFINNTATNYGGALSYTGSYMTLDNCTFIGNSATTYDGGAIHTENQASRTITNCVFINNKANRNAGAILLYGSSSTVNNCTFLSNTATSNGGAIYTTTAAKITSSLFKYNTADIASVLYSSVANTNLTDSVILDNVATGSGQYTIYSSVANSIANNNWFGNTLNDKTTIIPKVYRTILTNWYFLNIDATPTYSLTNVISNITVRLDQLSTSTGVVTLRGFEYSYPIDLNLTSNDGVLSINNVTLNKNNANLTFEIGDIGVYNLTAKHSGITAVKSVFHVPEDSISALNITLANATGVLNLTHNYKYYDEYDFEFIYKCIDINKTIYINGNGFTIDGKNKIRVMDITADKVTITNLTFVNGSASDGGAIYWKGSNGVLKYSIFKNNYATTQAGAVLWRGVNGTIDYCNFTNNIANGNHWAGGAVGWYGDYGLINNSNFIENGASNVNSGNAGDAGALVVFNCHVNIDNSLFSKNYASDKGGALGVDSGAYVDITNTIFKDNYMKKASGLESFGGAIYFYLSINRAFIKNCSFINNSASGNGGGIRTDSPVTILSSLFIDNRAAGGPLLYSDNKKVNISDCIILNHTVPNAGSSIVSSTNGGYITANNNWWGNTLQNKNVNPITNGKTTINNWYFLNIETNVTYLLKNDVCNVTFELDLFRKSDSSISHRKLDNELPKMFNYTVNIGNLSKSGVILSDLRLDNATYFLNETGVVNITLISLGVKSYKLIYYVPDDSFTALNMSLANATDVLNLTHDYKYYDEFDFAFLGTGIKIDKKITIQGNNHTIDAKSKVRVFYVTADEVTLNNLTLINGNAANGGAIYWVGNYGILNNSNVIKNFASLQGGGIFWAGHYGILEYSNITENWANGRGWTGGGIHWNGNYGIINHTTFDGNRAEYYDSADAGDAAGLAFSGKYLAIDYSRFIRSYGIQCGGAIGANHDAQYLNVTNTLFENNTAYKKSRNFDADGAAFYLGKNLVKVVIYNCTFIGNKASNRGGVILSASPVEMTSCFFKGNSANSGQVAAAYSSLSIVDSILLDNGNGYIFVTDSGTKVTADYNWFGNTVNNQKSRPSVSGTTLNYWYFLNLESNATLLLPNEVCKITARLDQVTTSAGVVSERRLNYPLPNVFNFTATIGNLDYYSIILNETRCVNNTFVTTVPGYCTVTVEALGKIASIKLSYVPNDSFTALNMLINQNYDSNLNLTHDYQYYQEFDSSFVSTGIKITAPINITGNGYSLKAKSKLRIFYITGNNVNIDGINFMNGYSTGSGGAIYIGGQYVNITNSNITSSSAWGYGGGADVVSNYVSFVNVSFKSNKVRVGSDKSNNYGGGALTIHNTAAYCSLIGCEFKSNYASESGGAILWSGPNGFVKDTYFESNNAQKYDGGAIYAKNSATNLLIDNITAYKNKDGGYGSAIASFATDTLINNSKFISNDYNNARKYGATVYFAASRGKIYNSYFEKNRAYNGGAISTQSWNSEIKNVTFIGNRAVNLGGAINIQGSPSNINISDCSFDGNYAGTTGGAIRVTSTKTNGLAITNSSFKNNHAYNYGGAISVQSAGARINGCYFDNNYVNKKNGGALDLNGVNIIVDNSTFNNNRGIYGGAIAWFKSGGKLTNSVFTNNRATGHDGAGLFVASGATNMYVCNVTMKDNVAKYAGSAIQSDATNTKIYNSSFIQNKNSQNSYGGTICFYKTGGYVYGCNFTKNNNFFGGGIYTRNKAYSITVENCNFVENTARSSGGGIHVTKNTIVTVIDSNFVGNYAKTCGGDLDTYGSGTKIVNSTFTNSNSPAGGSLNLGASTTVLNSNFTGSYASNKGGAINMGSSSKILNCNFNNTHATNYGGAIYMSGSNSVVNNSNFTSSNSNLGGAIYVAAKNIISNNLFVNNVANNYGGAIYLNGKSSIVNSSEFNNNRANKAGGSIYIAVVATVCDSNFTENIAKTYGGAIYVVAASSIIVNDTFNFNNATIDGGAVYVEGKSVLINQSVFNQNYGVNGPGIYWLGDNGILHASVVDNHTTTGLGAVYVKANGLEITLTNMSFNTAKNGGALYIVGNDANMDRLNLINNTANYGGALYVSGRHPTVSATNFTNNRARFGAGMFVGNDITLNPSNFTNNVAGKLGGAGYSFEFIDHVGTVLTYEDWDTQTDNFYSAYVKLLNDTIYVGQTVILQMINETYTGNVTLEIGNKTYNTTWINVTHRLADVSDLPWGVYSDIHAVYLAAGSEHNEEFALVDLTVNRYPINATLVNNVTTVRGIVNISVNESGADGNITLIFENGLEYEAPVIGGIASIQLNNLIPGGDHNVTIKYSGDDWFDEFTGPGVLHVNKLNATPRFEIDWAYVDGSFVVMLPEDCDGGELNITINGIVYEAFVTGNSTEIPLDGLVDKGKYLNVNISFFGNDLYNPSYNVTTFEVFNYPVDIVVAVNETDVNTTLVFFLNSDDPYDITGNVSFVINGVTYSGNVVKEYDDPEDTGGESSFSYIAYVDISGLPGGVYQNVTVKYNSDTVYYQDNEVMANFTVYKLESDIYYVGPEILDDDKKLVFNVTETTSGNVSFWYNGHLFYANLHDVVNASEAIIDVSSFGKGIYDVVVSYNGDDYFNPSNVTVRFVIKETPNIILNNIGDVYGNVDLKVNVTGNITGLVYIYVDGFKHEIVNVSKYTNDTTVFTVSLNNVSAGDHVITVEYPGDEIHFNNTVSMDLFIKKANSYVNITNYVNGTYNTTSVLVNFTVDNRTNVYINITNEEGELIYYNFTDKNYIILSGLDVGKYLIIISNEEVSNYNASSSSVYFNVFRANSFINVTGIVNGTYNTTSAAVNFDVTNRTNVTVIVYKNGTDVVVYNNTNFTGNVFSIGNLCVGIYNITILNNESGCYYEYIASVLFEVYKANSKVIITNVTNGYYNTTNATVKFDVTNRTNVTVVVYKNGTGIVVYNNTNFTGNVFSIGNLGAGVYNITITNQGNESYFMFNASTLFEVYKAKSFVNITDIVNGTYNTTNATVKFNVGNKTNVTIIVTKIGSSIKLIELTDFEGNILNLSKLGAGIYNITIINNENENFTQFNASALFEVYKAKSFVNITDIVNGTYNTTNVTVKYEVVNLTSVKIIVTRNGTDTVVYDSVYSGNFTIATLAAGVYNITIINEESDNYTMSKVSGLFEVFKAPSVTSITGFVNATYNTTNVKVEFDITNRTKVIITIINSTGDIVYSDDDFDGNLFVINTLDADNYNITITNSANENYTVSSDSILFSVFKAASSLNIIQVTNSTYMINQSVVTLNVVNKTSISYIIVNKDGTVVVSKTTLDDPIVLDDLPAGEYNITVINNENKNYLGSSDSAVFEVIKSYSEVHITEVINGTLDTSNTTVKFDVKVPTNISIIVRDDKGNVVYNNSDFKGNVFSIGGLPTGVYNITISNVETENAYASNDSTVFKVVVPTTIPSEDISRGYNSPYDYVAVFTDEFGNILNNTNVSMIVDGKVYNLTTDENGVAYLNDTLAVGKHEILLVNPVSGENRTHIVTIVERLQENKDIVMDFCDGTYYSVRAYGDDAKPIAGVTVTITVNGVSYDVVTNADGYALLKIRLNPKTYTITAEWKDYKINKIVVRQTLKAKSVKVKKSANKFKYSASLKWSSGKPIVGEIITFKFKGKTYKAKTNKKGIAKITFNKKVLSKLKAGKNYKINITYNHVDSGYTSVNSIVKKIKVKN